ncbi:erythrocyte membrane protein 1 (PfEMP1), putative [Plasmodium sp.]|nr:erythrocyte membrane protein 1 (PfEMP1), putative [Plasmodium sp.]
MGNTSSSEEKTKSVVPNETYNSPRNVLERLALGIKEKATADAKEHVNSLKGDLTQAVFRDAHFRKRSRQKYDNPYLCFLDYRWHTNLGKEWIHERHPCHGREQNRFDEYQKSECSNIYIRSYGNNSKATTCAPPRRRHMCDKNLEALNEGNTQNVDDLLGNVLVTAKYEGESIVNNHPHKGTSEVCIALARSFADIGDIVRGKDMFKPNDQDEVWKGLRSVFKKLNDNLKAQGIGDYNDGSGNYFKLREAWWNANRNKVWDAITCNAPYKSGYFMQSKSDTQSFSNYKCGHEQGNVPTNLDYVPQYLRWYDEWAEEFCRKRNINLKMAKRACRDEENGKYCGRNGYDCTQINRNENFPRGSKCTDCWAKCKLYEIWLGNEQEAFDKQKEKYEKEVNIYDSTHDSANNSINNKYYEDFYKKLKEQNYGTMNEFINLLNEGKYCNKKEKTEEENIDFKKTSDEEGTFYRSKYCQVCPYCGVNCIGKKCTPKQEIYPSCENNETYVPPPVVNRTKINVLYSGDEQGDIIKKLKDFCNKPTNYDGKNYEKWQCYYKRGKGIKCKMEKNSRNSMSKEKIKNFHNFFEMWVTYLLTETITWNDKLKECMNNTKTTDCIHECNTNCVCFDKWVKQKEQEWNSIKELLTKEQNMLQQYYLNINDLFDSFFFQVMNKLNGEEAKWKEHIEHLRTKIESSKKKKRTKDSEAAIELLLEYLKETATICKDNNTNEACDSSKKATKNPCAKSRDDNKQTTVKEIAQYYKRKAYNEANNRSDGLHKLKGKAHEGVYKQEGTPSVLNNVCKITKYHSNRNPEHSQEPCGGKGTGKGIDTRFVIETQWEKDEKNMRDGHKDVIMPLRRRHICTSNLEYLQSDDSELNGTLGADKINHSFLGDVLLSANHEAKNIIETYKKKNNLTDLNEPKDPKHQATICRSIRYSFADIGDIIRGRDIWDKEKGMGYAKGHLKTVFGNIYKSLKKVHPSVADKYNKDDEKHTKLREDWWEANRAKVWEAMKCHIEDFKDTSVDPSKGYCGYIDHTPLDDYIPQRLRWMTEWAEWYCKKQSQEYDKLEGKFKKCIDEGNRRKNCNKNDPECEKCKKAIDAYKAKMDPWKKQWIELDKQYRAIYAEARIAAGIGGARYYIARVKEKDKPVFNFLYDLYIQNGGIVGPPPVPFSQSTEPPPTSINTPYDNAGAYVHDTGNLSDCKEGKEFCNRAITFNVLKNTLKEDDDDSSDSESKPKAPAPLPDVDEVCNIVEGILTVDTLKEACSRKYVNGKEKFPNWRCISSGSDATGARSRRSVTTTATSGLCVPPRRRKLYIHDLQSLGAEGGTTPSHDELLKWFVKSAAVETFFLWHRYKKEWALQHTVGTTGLVGTLQLLDGGRLNLGDDDPKPEDELKQGRIPDGFLRQMFYTLADYKDILDGKYIVGDTNNSGDNKDTVTLKQKIDNFFEQSGKNQESGRPQKSATENPRIGWWKTNGEHIWNGMICALTYTDSGQKGDGGKPTQIDAVKSALLDTSGTNPKNNLYKYDKVVLKEDDSGGEKARTASPTSQSTQLTDFISRPPYFRWLEEWGEKFCRQKARMLKNVKDNCRPGIYGDKTCSGDGFECKTESPKKEDIFKPFYCSTCSRHCRFYKKWINTKRNEFNKQSNAYNQQKIDAEVIKDGNAFSTILGNCTDAAEFLERLKTGPCSKTNNESEEDNNKIFKDEAKTFQHTDLCDPCSQFKVKCNGNGSCSVGETKVTCNRKNGTINAKDIGNVRDSTKKLDMLVSDNSTTEFKGDGLQQACGSANIFKGIRKDEWECGKVCGLDICTLKKEDKNVEGDKKYILIKELLKRWLEYFFEDYNKINMKISRSTKNGEGSTCINGCTDKYKCVEQWIKEKMEEWKKIKKDYFEQNQNDGTSNTLKSFLEQAPFYTEVQKAIKPCDSLTDFENSIHCNGSAKLENSKDGNKSYIIDCLLKKLEDKAKKCKEDHTQTGDKPPKPCDKSSTPVEDNDEPLEETENPVGKQQPSFCSEPQPPSEPADEEDTCTPASSSPEVPTGPPDACKIVEEILEGKNENNNIEDCKHKYDPKKDLYPKWDCENKTKTGEKGACMPPRRIKLCVNNLQKLSVKTSDGLRKAFIQCAAIETFWLWHKYKTDNNSVHEETKLNSGTIPEEFKRQMYYTFGDYRDLCLDKNIGNDVSDVENNIKAVFSKDNKTVSGLTRETWWEKHGPEIWKGMVCGLSHHIKNEEKVILRKKLTDNNKYSTISSTLEDFASRPPFLRWFTEWADQFCQEHKVEKAKLLDKCNNVDCSNEDESHETIKLECEKACTAYEQWIKDWKDQYNKQKRKFDKDKRDKKFDDTPAANYIDEEISAHEYLHEQLEKLCINGDCSCMEKTSTQNEETNLSGNNYFPEALDIPPQEIRDKCECSEHSEAMSCVEKTAQKLRKDAEKNVKNYESSLKGNGKNYNGTCNLIEKQNSTNGEYSCEFEKLYPNAIKSLNVSCDNNGKERFKIEEEWKCDGQTADGKNKLCIPPRRKYMCLKNLDDISVKDITDSHTLLQKIQDIAKNEGDNIIKNLLPKYPCNENIICDAMKYSFADIGDIIRGRIRIKPNNDNNIEEKLQEIFTNLKTRNNSFRNIDLTQFREKWWDANRKEVWKAMTCNAPKDAHLKTRINKPSDNSQNTDTKTEKEKCGNDKEPPDYDYIPERHRSLQEWSEYYCKTLIEKNDEMKNKCSECLKNGTCENENNKENCKECIRKCKDYSKFVDKWKAQFEEQNEIYKELYTHARSYGPNAARRDFSIKFIQQLDKICEDPNTAEKYLDKSTHCTDYKFSETNNNENDAFSQYPKDFKDKCKCKEKPLPSHLGKNVISFIQNSFKPPKIPGLKTIEKAVPQIPRTIKNIRPDAHTIHELVAKSFPYFVPFFQEDDKTPPTHNILNDVLPSAIPVGIALALTSIAFLYLKKKSKSTVDLLRVLNIPKGEYEMPTLKSSNRYIPYASDRYKGKTYIYMEGDSGDEDKYMFLSDSTDITSSESEYEELDINDIYVPGSPKYKTLIEVVLEPSKRDTPSDDTPSNDIQPTNRFTDEEWSELKHNFISQYLPNTEPNTLYFNKHEEKPFITSIHDRDLYTGEEIKYNINMTNTNNDIPMSGKNDVYSGIDLINDALSGEPIDIYDEVLKRKENELFGTKHPKRTSNNSVAKNINNDPIMNQLDLLHKWLDRHRDMCEQWNKKKDILKKLNEEWNKDNGIGDIPNDNKTLNTDVSIQIDMDDTKGKKEFTNMDTYPENSTMDSILEDLDKYNEPYYDVQDDIYYDVHDRDTSTVDSNNMDVPSKVQIEMDVNTKLVKEKYPIADVWDI